MKLHRLLIVAFAGLALLGVAACSSSGSSESSVAAPTVTDADETATELANEWFQLLHDADISELDAFLSPAFQLQRANGSGADKAEYLQAPAEVEVWEISDVVGTWDGSVLVARYSVVTTETIDGELFSTQPAPRISAFAWNGDRWQLAAHANFNVPEQR